MAGRGIGGPCIGISIEFGGPFLIQVNQTACPDLIPGDFSNTGRAGGVACDYAADLFAAKFRALM